MEVSVRPSWLVVFPTAVALLVVSYLRAAAREPAGASSLRAGEELLARGQYRAARDAFEGAALVAPQEPRPLLGAARVYEARGRLEDVGRWLDRAAALAPEDPEVLWARGRWLLRRGSAAEAAATLDRAVSRGSPPLGAFVDLGVARERLGQNDSARAAWRQAVDGFNARQPDDYASLVAAARAARRTRDPHGAMRLLARAAKSPGVVPVEALAEAGDLFLSTWQVGEAERELLAAQALNPRHAPTLLGLARLRLLLREREGAVALARRALAVDPSLAPALALVARVRLLANAPEAAAAELEAARRVDPGHPEVVAVEACRRLVAGDSAGVERLLAQRAQEAPGDATALLELGTLAAQGRRNVEAEGYLRRALTVDPHAAVGWRELAELLFRDGREEEARESFDRAHALDPFHVPVVNFRAVLDMLAEDFAPTFPCPGFVVRASARTDAFWRPTLDRAVAELVPILTARYGAAPRGPFAVEVFAEQRWLAARSVGLPDVPALGVYLGGGVLAMDSPLVDQPPFSWRRVLTHELSHAFQFAATDGRIPRWLTEGLAQLDEGSSEPPRGWLGGFRLYAELRELRPIADLDRAFVEPRTAQELPSAYVQARVAVRVLVERVGAAGLKAGLAKLKRGEVPPARALEAFGAAAALGPELLEACYAAARRVRLVPPECLREAALCRRAASPAPQDGDGSLDDTAVTSEPFGAAASDDARTRVAVWAALERRHVDRARELLRTLVKRATPAAEDLALAGDLLSAEGQEAGAERYWRRALERSPDEPSALLGLAEVEARGGRPDRALAHLQRAVALPSPGPEAVARCRAALRAAGRFEDEAALLAARAAADPDDLDSRLALGDRALAAGRPAEGLRWFREAAEIRPQAPGLLERQRAAAEAAGDQVAASAATRSSYALLLARGERGASALWSAARTDAASAEALVEALESSRSVERLAVLTSALAAPWPPVRRAAASLLAREGRMEGLPTVTAWLQEQPGEPRAVQAMEALLCRPAAEATAAVAGRPWRQVAEAALAEAGYSLAGLGPDEQAGVLVLAMDDRAWYLRHAAHLLLQEQAGRPYHRDACWSGAGDGVSERYVRDSARGFFKVWLKGRLAPAGGSAP